MGFQLGSRGWTDQGGYRFGGWRKTRLGESGGHQFSGSEFFQTARNPGDERQHQVRRKGLAATTTPASRPATVGSVAGSLAAGDFASDKGDALD